MPDSDLAFRRGRGRLKLRASRPMRFDDVWLFPVTDAASLWLMRTVDDVFGLPLSGQSSSVGDAISLTRGPVMIVHSEVRPIVNRSHVSTTPRDEIFSYEIVVADRSERH